MPRMRTAICAYACGVCSVWRVVLCVVLCGVWCVECVACVPVVVVCARAHAHIHRLQCARWRKGQ